jgi:putative amino-acid transport system permease protein
MNLFDVSFVFRVIPIMFRYLHVTISISVISLLFAAAISILIVVIGERGDKLSKAFIAGYVSFFRGTPLIAQLFFLYFGVVQIFPAMKSMDAYTAVVIGLSLNAAAYMSESIRGGLSGVDKGQMDACQSIGMTYIQSMRRIILPQAFRIALPSLTNNFIDIIKGSALAFTLGVTEIMAVAQMEGASAYRFTEAFACVIIMYWLMISVISYVQKRVEVRLGGIY